MLTLTGRNDDSDDGGDGRGEEEEAEAFMNLQRPRRRGVSLWFGDPPWIPCPSPPTLIYLMIRRITPTPRNILRYVLNEIIVF